MSFAITLPDGSKKEYEDEVSVSALAHDIGTSLGKAAIGAKVNGQVVSLDYELNKDAEVAIITDRDEAGLNILRATVAFVFEAVAKKAYPEIHFGEHAANEDGFLVDTDKENQIKVNELPELEKAIKKVIKAGNKIASSSMSKAELSEIFKDDPYKSELLKTEKDDQIHVYKLGNFIDFGFDALLPNTGKIKQFKLLSVAGAYWKGQSSNPMLQRISGTAFFKKADLDADIKRREEIKERDHRTIGRDLDLFFVDPKVGAGLPCQYQPKIHLHSPHAHQNESQDKLF